MENHPPNTLEPLHNDISTKQGQLTGMDKTAHEALNRSANAVPADHAVATARWEDPALVAKMRHFPDDNIMLGQEGNLKTPEGNLIGHIDDKHMVTVAGSRAGKGRSAIIPALLDYRGSVFVLDPKGENADITANRRGKGNEYVQGLGQKVAILDPFGTAKMVRKEYRKSFNPLDWLPDDDKAIYQAHTIAEGFILGDSNADSHWDESGKGVIQALILHVKSWKYYKKANRHLPYVRQLLMEGDLESRDRWVKKCEKGVEKARIELETADTSDMNEKEAEAEMERLKADVEQAELDLDTAQNANPKSFLYADMKKNDAYGGFVRRWAMSWTEIPPNEKGSIESTAKRHTLFLEGEEMANVLSKSDFDLKELRTAENGFSLFLCLPAKYLNSHGRWLRAMLSQTLGAFEDLGTAKRDAPRVLFVLDEFASLGYINLLEKAAGLMAGYGVKLWFILQDLTQLKRHYKEGWETFIGNAGVLQFFGISDKTTCEYVASKLGKIELQRETVTTSQGTSSSSALSRGSTTGTSEGTARGFDPAVEASRKALGGFVQTGDSSGRTSGTSSGSTDTSGSTSSESRAVNFTQSNLLNADEIAVLTERDQNSQIVFIDGKRPMFLTRRNYDDSVWFEGKRHSGVKLEKLKADQMKWLKEYFDYDPNVPLPEIPERQNEWQQKLAAIMDERVAFRGQEMTMKNQASWAGIVAGFLSAFVLSTLMENFISAVFLGGCVGAIAYVLIHVGIWLYWSKRERGNTAQQDEIRNSDGYQAERTFNKEIPKIERQRRFLEDKKYRFDHYIWKLPFVWKEDDFPEPESPAPLPDISSLTVHFDQPENPTS